MQYVLFIILAPLATIVALTVIIQTWRYRATVETRLVIVQMLVASGWLIANSIELLAATPRATLVWAKVTYLFITSTPVIWLLFAAHYTDRAAWLAAVQVITLWIIPATTVLLVATNDWHHLVWRRITFRSVAGMLTMDVTQYGPWFWIHAIYAYLLILLGTYLIGQEYFKSLKLYRQQSIWLVLGALIPVAINVIYLFDLIPGLRKDYSPIGFALAGAAIAIGMLRYRLLDVKPVAREVLVDEMNDGMLVLDERNRLLDLNPAAERIIGHRADGAIGLAASEVLPSEWVTRLQEETTFQAELTLDHRGMRQHYDLRASSLTNRRGRATGRLILIHDITLLKQAEATLQETNQRLKREITRRETLIKELDNFAHTAAHDLRAPLSVLIGYSDLLIEDVERLEIEERSIHEFARTIGQTAQKMSRIIDEILLLTSVRKQEVVPGPLVMENVLAEAENRLARMIEETGAEIVKPLVWPEAQGYAPWVEEVWANYISNAIKYGGDPPRVELGATEEEDAVHFWVRDNGDGLSQEAQARLFNEFARLTHGPFTGHGLGLSIVKRIVEKLGGEVDVESTGRPGEGSTFSFTLPKAE